MASGFFEAPQHDEYRHKLMLSKGLLDAIALFLGAL